MSFHHGVLDAVTGTRRHTVCSISGCVIRAKRSGAGAVAAVYVARLLTELLAAHESDSIQRSAQYKYCHHGHKEHVTLVFGPNFDALCNTLG